MTKVLVAFPIEDISKVHTGLSIRRGFEALGCEVLPVCARNDFAELYNKAKKFKPDVVLCSRSPQLFHNALKIRCLLPHIKVFTWNVDTRKNITDYGNEFGQELLGLFEASHLVYLVVDNEVNRFNANGWKAKQLLQGIDPEIDEKRGERYKYDISFLCNNDKLHESYCDRGNLIRALQDEFGGRLNLQQAFAEDAAEVYYTSRINIGNNASWWDGVGCSVRDFKIQGAGGFLLTTYMVGYEDAFEIGKELDVYKSVDECVEMCRHYLCREEERERMAEYGYVKAHEQYRYEDRCRIILGDLV